MWLILILVRQANNSFHSIIETELLSLRGTHMEKEYTVRADFYPCGEIIPLGITDCQGNSLFIQKTIKVQKVEKGGLLFECLANNKRKLLLTFKDNKWIVEYM